MLMLFHGYVGNNDDGKPKNAEAFYGDNAETLDIRKETEVQCCMCDEGRASVNGKCKDDMKLWTHFQL